MGQTYVHLKKSALELNAAQRARLIDELMESFDAPDRESIDREWAAEAKRRLSAYKAGKMKAEPMDKVLKEIQGKRRNHASRNS